MKIYQLHLGGKNRAYHNFKSSEEALDHKRRLIELCKMKISGGSKIHRKYLKEAIGLEVVEIFNGPLKTYNIMEYCNIGASVYSKNYVSKAAAEIDLESLKDSKNRNFTIIESIVYE